MDYLTEKIQKGGAGVWGEVAMAAHPNLPKEDLHQIVTWILSLAGDKPVQKSLPASGSIVPPANVKPNTVMVITASYTDKGGNNIKALTGTNIASLSSSTYLFNDKETMNGFKTFKYNGMNIMMFPDATGSFGTTPVDLSGVRSVSLTCGWQTAPDNGFGVEARLDSPDGKLLGSGTLPKPVKGQQGGMVKIALAPVEDGKMHSLFIVYKGTDKVAGGFMNMVFASK